MNSLLIDYIHIIQIRAKNNYIPPSINIESSIIENYFVATHKNIPIAINNNPLTPNNILNVYLQKYRHLFPAFILYIKLYILLSSKNNITIFFL